MPDQVAPEPLSVGEAVPADRQVQDLLVLLDVARALAGSMVLDDLLTLILDAARRVLHADRASLFLYDPQTNELWSKIAHGVGEIRFPADRGLAGAAAQGRRTINVADAHADPRFFADVDRQTGYRTRSLLTIPLVGLDDQLVGVVQVINKVTGPFTEYDERLGSALAAHAGVALQRARLMEHYVQKKQMERSLALARDIQQGLLPRAVPRVPGYDIAGWSQAAEETGGDCYDWVARPDGCLAVVVADASGHGIGPALVIAETRALLRAVAGEARDPAAVLARANTWLCADLDGGRFVTAVFAMLDPKTHELRHASAGHGPTLWYRAGTREVSTSGADTFPLGVTEPLEFPPVEPFAFAPGDVAVFLTDGLVEAPGMRGGQFGRDRLARVLVEYADRPAAECVRALEAAVRQFTGAGPQADDWTAVVVKRCAG